MALDSVLYTPSKEAGDTDVVLEKSRAGEASGTQSEDLGYLLLTHPSQFT